MWLFTPVTGIGMRSARARLPGDIQEASSARWAPGRGNLEKRFE
ncbi:hypothetical protein M3J09_004092 [Ascochyta lentis]